MKINLGRVLVRSFLIFLFLFGVSFAFIDSIGHPFDLLTAGIMSALLAALISWAAEHEFKGEK